MSGPLTVEDRFEIKDLLAEYAWAVATGDVQAFEQLFTDDAEMIDTAADLHYRGRGPGGITAFLEDWMRVPTSPGRQHWILGTLLEGDSTECVGRSYIMAPDRCPIGVPATMLMMIGHYTDRIVKVDWRWRFRERLIRPWWGEALSGFAAMRDGDDVERA